MTPIACDFVTSRAYGLQLPAAAKNADESTCQTVGKDQSVSHDGVLLEWPDKRDQQRRGRLDVPLVPIHQDARLEEFNVFTGHPVCFSGFFH